MKVLLIGYNVQDNVFPLGLNYLRGFAKEKHSDVEILIKEFNVGNRVSNSSNKAIELQTLSLIEMESPDLVCFSSYIWSIDIIKSVAVNLRKINPDIKILIGGVEVNDGSLNYCDFICEGEGEEAFSRIISYLKGDLDLAEVCNISYLADGKVVKNKRELIYDLDVIPFPYSKENSGDYTSIRIETSRGCPFSCKYCYYASAKKARHFSIEYLEKNMDSLMEDYEFRHLTILDPNMNIYFDRMKSILDLIQKKAAYYNKKFVLNFELKPELITSEITDYLDTYPLRINTELGLQSTDNDVMSACTRPYNLDKVKEGLKLLDDSKINYKIDLMYGLPRDNFYKFLNSCRFVLKYAKSQNKVPAHHFMLLNNTGFSDNSEIVRINEENSSMVLKTKEQSPLDLYKTKLFIETLNRELKLS